MAKAKTDDNVVLSLTEGDETVTLTVAEDGNYTLDTKVTGPVMYEPKALIDYLLGVRRLEIGQTSAVRAFAPIALDKLGN